METWRLYCEVQTSVVGEAGAVISLFLLAFFKPCEHGQPEHPGRLFLCPSKGTIMNRNRLNRGSIAASHDRTESVEGLKDCAQRSDPRLCKYSDVYFPSLCEDRYLSIYLQKSCVFHAFLVAMMFAVIKLVPGLFVCLYITLQCWKVLSCLLFLSRLIYLRRLRLGNCQSNIFYIVIFAQLL